MDAFRVRSMIAGAVLFAVSVPAIAGPYDFNYRNVNDMRKAWLICGITGFKEGDCPTVRKKCFQPPMLKLTGGSKCTKAPKFTDENKDAQVALADGYGMSGSEPQQMAIGSAEEAAELNASTNPITPCAGTGANARACQQAIDVDRRGVEAYELEHGKLNDDVEVGDSIESDGLTTLEDDSDDAADELGHLK